MGRGPTKGIELLDEQRRKFAKVYGLTRQWGRYVKEGGSDLNVFDGWVRDAKDTINEGNKDKYVSKKPVPRFILPEEIERQVVEYRLRKRWVSIQEMGHGFDTSIELLEDDIQEAKKKDNEKSRRNYGKRKQELAEISKRKYKQGKGQNMRRDYISHREWAIHLKGGKCVVSGATQDLHFAHRDPATKSLDLSRRLSSKNARENPVVLEELKKVNLLAPRIHAAYDRTFARYCPQTDKTFWEFVEHYQTYLSKNNGEDYSKWIRTCPPENGH